jgi:hypothetical protein
VAKSVSSLPTETAQIPTSQATRWPPAVALVGSSSESATSRRSRPAGTPAPDAFAMVATSAAVSPSWASRNPLTPGAPTSSCSQVPSAGTKEMPFRPWESRLAWRTSRGAPAGWGCSAIPILSQVGRWPWSHHGSVMFPGRPGSWPLLHPHQEEFPIKMLTCKVRIHRFSL